MFRKVARNALKSLRRLEGKPHKLRDICFVLGIEAPCRDAPPTAWRKLLVKELRNAPPAAELVDPAKRAQHFARLFWLIRRLDGSYDGSIFSTGDAPIYSNVLHRSQSDVCPFQVEFFGGSTSDDVARVRKALPPTAPPQLVLQQIISGLPTAVTHRAPGVEVTVQSVILSDDPDGMQLALKFSITAALPNIVVRVLNKHLFLLDVNGVLTEEVGALSVTDVRWNRQTVARIRRDAKAKAAAAKRAAAAAASGSETGAEETEVIGRPTLVHSAAHQNTPHAARDENAGSPQQDSPFEHRWYVITLAGRCPTAVKGFFTYFLQPKSSACEPDAVPTESEVRMLQFGVLGLHANAPRCEDVEGMN